MSSKKTTVGAGSAAIKDDGPEPIHDTPPPPPADPKPCDVKPVPTLAETLEDFDTRPVPNDWLKRVESNTPAHPLYEPSTPHDNLLDALSEHLLDALSEHCGIQWGIKRPMAEAIVAAFVWQQAMRDIALRALNHPPADPEKQPEETHEPEYSK